MSIGFESYGLYWAIIEMLRNEATYKLPLNKNTYRAIKMQTGTSIDVEKYLSDCINEYTDSESGNGLFNTDNKSFWSASLLRRMEKYEDLKEKRSQAANARWNKEKKKEKDTKGNAKQCKSIRKICKCNASAYKKKYKSNTKLKNVYAKLCKLNEIKSNQKKLNKIKLNEIKSIYPSNHSTGNSGSSFLEGMMDEIDKTVFDNIVTQSKVGLYSHNGSLGDEITEIMKEIYMNPVTREKIMNITISHIDYALRNFAVANTKQKIQKPKAYFKQCLLSALEQTELSKQLDTDTIYEMGDY